MSKSDTTVKREHRLRDREATNRELQRAILKVQEKGLKMSFAAVAFEVGVTPGLIHNTYPVLAEEIRTLMGRSTRQQRDDMAARLADARARLKDVRAERDDAKRDVAKLASINESLRDEIVLLRAQIADKVRVMPKRKGR